MTPCSVLDLTVVPTDALEDCVTGREHIANAWS